METQARGFDLLTSLDFWGMGFVVLAIFVCLFVAGALAVIAYFNIERKYVLKKYKAIVMPEIYDLSALTRVPRSRISVTLHKASPRQTRRKQMIRFYGK